MFSSFIIMRALKRAAASLKEEKNPNLIQTPNL